MGSQAFRRSDHLSVVPSHRKIVDPRFQHRHPNGSHHLVGEDQSASELKCAAHLWQVIVVSGEIERGVRWVENEEVVKCTGVRSIGESGERARLVEKKRILWKEGGCVSTSIMATSKGKWVKRGSMQASAGETL